MTAQVLPADRAAIYDMIAMNESFTPVQAEFFSQCVRRSQNVWVGLINEQLACVWGLIPPSLIATKAYLWLYTTSMLSGNEFMFIRRSQIVVKEMLEEYPEIIGHAVVSNTRAIRWLKWLGAEFSEPDGKLLPFTIRRK